MKYLDTQDLLGQAIKSLDSSPWIAVDTEADSLHHYYEKLCLLQLSIAGEDFVIDPLAPLDMAPLIRLLNNKPLILHGADFDIRILRRFHDFLPSDIFDTMIAAQLLGYEKQSLADLAKKHCDVNLPKGNQTADWSKRPLEESMIIYAANDTHYLKSIEEKLREELEALGRLQWQKECCQKLIQSIATKKEAKITPGFEWQVKGAKDLNPRALTNLRELWRWREEQARLKDRPPFKILHSEMLLKIAAWAVEPSSIDVAHLPQAPRNLKNEYRDDLNNIIEQAKKLPPTPFTAKASKLNKNKWSNASEARLKILKEEREKIAKELKIQPSLLATNVILETLVAELPKTSKDMIRPDLLMPWQAEVLSQPFLTVLKIPLKA